MEDILMYSIVSVLQMLVFAFYLKEMLGLKRSVLWMLVCWGLLEVVDWIVTRLAHSTVVNGFVYLMLLEIIVFWMCCGSWKKKVFLIIAFAVVITVLEIIFINIVIISGICDMDTISGSKKISDLILILVQMFAFVLFQFVAYFWKHYVRYDASSKNWLGILLVSAGCFLSVVLLTMNMINLNNFSVDQVLVLLILICMNFLSYYFYSVSAAKSRIEMEAGIYQKQIVMYREWYEGIQQARREMECFRHDMNNHLSVLQRLCENGKEERNPAEYLSEISDYLHTIGINFGRMKYGTDTGNLMIDSIVDMKKGYAMSKGIIMTDELYIPKDMKYNSLDVVVLLGNLLDNAIEAVQIPAAGKNSAIQLKIQYRMSNLVILVRNTYDGHLDGQSGDSANKVLPKTTKKDRKIHGIGMKSVRRIVEKYNGIIEWRAENGIFSIDILLYGFDEKMRQE